MRESGTERGLKERAERELREGLKRRPKERDLREGFTRKRKRAQENSREISREGEPHPLSLK